MRRRCEKHACVPAVRAQHIVTAQRGGRYERPSAAQGVLELRNKGRARWGDAFEHEVTLIVCCLARRVGGNRVDAGQSNEQQSVHDGPNPSVSNKRPHPGKRPNHALTPSGLVLGCKGPGGVHFPTSFYQIRALLGPKYREHTPQGGHSGE